MEFRSLRFVLFSVMVITAACGGAARTGSTASGSVTSSTAATSAPRASAPIRGSANLIVGAEIATSGASDALQAIRTLRPSMLRGRTGTRNDQSGAADIVVYVDGIRAGGPQTLESVAAITVTEIRFLNASDATTRFGTGHPMGAILVSTKH